MMQASHTYKVTGLGDIGGVPLLHQIIAELKICQDRMAFAFGHKYCTFRIEVSPQVDHRMKGEFFDTYGNPVGESMFGGTFLIHGVPVFAMVGLPEDVDFQILVI